MMVHKLFVIAALVFPLAVHAAPPDVKTPTPVIYLADNLDEARGIGWCLDTVGRGRSDRMHVHSCKPQGGDVQFRIDQFGRINSVAFPDLCAEVSPTGLFLLTNCEAAPSKPFTFDSDSGEIRHNGSCLAAGDQSRSAGPFQSRDLVLTECETAPDALKMWVVKE